MNIFPLSHLAQYIESRPALFEKMPWVTRYEITIEKITIEGFESDAQTKWSVEIPTTALQFKEVLLSSEHPVETDSWKMTATDEAGER